MPSRFNFRLECGEEPRSELGIEFAIEVVHAGRAVDPFADFGGLVLAFGSLEAVVAFDPVDRATEVATERVGLQGLRSVDQPGCLVYQALFRCVGGGFEDTGERVGMIRVDRALSQSDVEHRDFLEGVGAAGSLLGIRVRGTLSALERIVPVT
ncbi:MAG: hypothetical protein IH940_11810 [Acidobacteria bacterium]|nr:hypothetical protein [Acidobacteriota bacterium]